VLRLLFLPLFAWGALIKGLSSLSLLDEVCVCSLLRKRKWEKAGKEKKKKEGKKGKKERKERKRKKKKEKRRKSESPLNLSGGSTNYRGFLFVWKHLIYQLLQGKPNYLWDLDSGSLRFEGLEARMQGYRRPPWCGKPTEWSWSWFLGNNSWI